MDRSSALFYLSYIIVLCLVVVSGANSLILVSSPSFLVKIFLKTEPMSMMLRNPQRRLWFDSQLSQRQGGAGPPDDRHEWEQVSAWTPLCLRVRAKSLQLCLTLATPWTIVHQAPLLHGISQARILKWVPMPPPGDLSNPRMEPASPALQAANSGPPRCSCWLLPWTLSGELVPAQPWSMLCFASVRFFYRADSGKIKVGEPQGGIEMPEGKCHWHLFSSYQHISWGAL